MLSPEERNWMDGRFDYIIVKIDAIKDDVSEHNTHIALAETALKTLYGRTESHLTEPCAQVEKGINDHKETEHRLTGGKLLAVVMLIITVIGAVVTLTLSFAK